MSTFPVSGYSGAIDPHWGTNRGGADIFAPRGTPVVSVGSGHVTDAGYSPVGGNNVTVAYPGGFIGYYAHLNGTPLVRTGDSVAEGQQIGVVGDTGNAAGTGTHLHFGYGFGIRSGGGAAGGTGIGFDAVAWLQEMLGVKDDTKPVIPDKTTQPDTQGVDYRDVARQAAAKYGIDVNVFLNQINQESGFNPNARSSAGAIGIAQIVPQYHPGVDPTDPIASLDYAAKLDASYLAMYGGSWVKALVAYNAGPARVEYLDQPVSSWPKWFSQPNTLRLFSASTYRKVKQLIPRPCRITQQRRLCRIIRRRRV